MSIRISSNTPDDEPGNTLLPVRDRIDEDLRTHPAGAVMTHVQIPADTTQRVDPRNLGGRQHLLTARVSKRTASGPDSTAAPAQDPAGSHSPRYSGVSCFH